MRHKVRRRPMPSGRARPLTAVAVLVLLASAGCGRHIIGDDGAAELRRIHELEPTEGVFAYSRISPDGTHLVYAAEDPDGVALNRVLKLVRLETRQVVFSERGIDAYFSPDGDRMIYLSYESSAPSVSIRDNKSGEVYRDVAPDNLGDYYSWAKRDGHDLILTINSNYFRVEGNRGVLPNLRVPACPGIGMGDRPLISKDGSRITTFVRGRVVVRSLDNCDGIFDTGIEGAKADFSYDGNLLAMHAPKESGRGTDILVVDLRDRTMRNITAHLPGSSYFPSWTEDGRISFRYDGADFRGFMMAGEVLRVPAKPLPSRAQQLTPARVTWLDVFPETPSPQERVNVVLVWGPWSAHAPEALRDMQEAQFRVRSAGLNAALLTASDPVSDAADVFRFLRYSEVTIPLIPLAPGRVKLTGLHNQNPTTMMFVNGALTRRVYGAQSSDAIIELIKASAPPL